MARQDMTSSAPKLSSALDGARTWWRASDGGASGLLHSDSTASPRSGARRLPQRRERGSSRRRALRFRFLGIQRHSSAQSCTRARASHLEQIQRRSECMAVACARLRHALASLQPWQQPPYTGADGSRSGVGLSTKSARGRSIVIVDATCPAEHRLPDHVWCA